MTAVACLRVLLDGNRTDVPAEALGPLVAKYAGIFLEVRWTFPKSAERLTDYCYLLTDPQAEEFNTVELANLSRELQLRLFGTASDSSVRLVLFEGDPEAIATFAKLSSTQVVNAMNDTDRLPPGGRLRRIARDGSLIDMPEPTPAPPALDDEVAGPSIDAAQGVYFPARQTFVADILSCTPAESATYFSLVDGEEHLPPDSEAFDTACIMTALRFLVDFAVSAPLYVPVSFSTLIRPTQRDAYVEFLGILPPETRASLGATVYDVPRAPSFHALKMVRDALDGHFSAVDLQTQDPDFEIQQLSERAVHSVTFVLPSGRSDLRLSALRRFASHSYQYRRRRIHPGVTNLRFRAERDLALSLPVTFLSGPGICRIQSEPVGGRVWPTEDLPLLSVHTSPSTADAAE